MLNISKQIYIGWNSTSHILPEVSIIPLGDSVEEKKKLEKFVINNSMLAEHDNTPLPGFTLYDVGKKKWSSADSTWIVIDPRGFMARITQENMCDILRVTGITEGLIQQQCVWVREDSQSTMILMPTTSPEYLEAVQNTELIEGRVSLHDIEIGDTVLLQNKLQGTYLGVQSLYCSMGKASFRSNFKVLSEIRKQVIETAPGKFYYHTNAKILKVLKKTTTVQTREEACTYLNNSICCNPATYFTPYDRTVGHYYGSNGRVKLASVHAVPKVPIKLVEIDLLEATSILCECQLRTDPGCLVLEDSAGKQYTVDFPWWSATLARISKDQFHIDQISSVEKDCIVHVDVPFISSQLKPIFKLDFFVKYYKIVKSVKNDTYI